MGPEVDLQGVTKGKKLQISVWNRKSVVQKAVSIVTELSRYKQNKNTQGVFKKENTPKICSITITGK